MGKGREQDSEVDVPPVGQSSPTTADGGTEVEVEAVPGADVESADVESADLATEADGQSADDGAAGADDPSSSNALVLRDENPPTNLFLVPHDTIVVVPELVVPFVLREEGARKTAEQARSQTEFIGCVLKLPDVPEDHSAAKQVHRVGCVARVIRPLTLPDESLSIVVRGLKRFRVTRFLRTKPYLIARVEYPPETRGTTDEAQAMMRVLRGLIRKIISTDDAMPDDFKLAAATIESPGHLADFAGTYFVREAATRQKILEQFDIQDRLEIVISVLTREVGLLELGKRIQDQIRERLEKQQRDFFLREQLKEIQKELGEAKDEKTVAIERLQDQIDRLTLPEAVERRVDEELERFRLIPMESPESAVIRNYLDWIAALPWGVYTRDRTDLAVAEKILVDSHFGLDEVKERVLEFLAVRKLKPDHRGPILCFVGPPGVGKTSLGKAIAESLGRKFVRISLGGVRDEAEIRGHRRTYVGAMPGRILQSLKTAGASNPVFMLDELDKIGVDFRGDPASALLEALDPEQNVAFSDHFLEVPFDLSRVLFVATANTLSTIPPPLLDRLEVIDIPGYTTNEKIGIGERYLLPRQIERHGLKPKLVSINKPGMRKLIHRYTREAGVRNLEQQLARICRKIASKAARGRARAVKITPTNLATYLGPERFHDEKALKSRRPGVVTGLSFTPVGGLALSVEATSFAGNGKLNLTGMLGDVMLESARIALSHVRAYADEYGIAPVELSAVDVHLHVPAGAVPKDGPSAGITMATALLSLLSGRAVKSTIAMTGELTLTGKVLPVGGLRNKVLAARQAGIKDVLVPADNQPDIEELTDEVRSGLRFHFVDRFAEVVDFVFAKPKAARRRQETRK